MSVERLLDMENGEISAITRTPAATAGVVAALRQIPFLEVDATVQPITRTIIRIKLALTPTFRWNDRLHGLMQPFWIWVRGRLLKEKTYFLMRFF